MISKLKKLFIALSLVGVCHGAELNKQGRQVSSELRKERAQGIRVVASKTGPVALEDPRNPQSKAATAGQVVPDISELPDTKKKTPDSLPKRGARAAGKIVEALPQAPQAIKRLKGPATKVPPTKAKQPKKRFSDPKFETTE